MCDVGALLVQQAKCALSMEKALADVKDKLAHHQQEACSVALCNLILLENRCIIYHIFILSTMVIWMNR